MSIGNVSGIPASVAGAGLSQQASEVGKARQDATARERVIQTEQQAADAARVGETDGKEHQTNERDADGRRPWEITGHRSAGAAAPETIAEAPRQSRDATGDAGGQLDLSG